MHWWICFDFEKYLKILAIFEKKNKEINVKKSWTDIVLTNFDLKLSNTVQICLSSDTEQNEWKQHCTIFVLKSQNLLRHHLYLARRSLNHYWKHKLGGFWLSTRFLIVKLKAYDVVISYLTRISKIDFTFFMFIH